MLRKTFKPRFIDPSCVDVGDIIQVSWANGGIEHSRKARVHRKLDDGQTQAFYTQEGFEIMHWVVGNRLNPKVVLIDRPEATDTLTELIGFNDLNDKAS